MRLVGKASDPDLSRGVKGQVGGPSTALAWRDLLFLCAVDLLFPKMRLAVAINWTVLFCGLDKISDVRVCEQLKSAHIRYCLFGCVCLLTKRSFNLGIKLKIPGVGLST